MVFRDHWRSIALLVTFKALLIQLPFRTLADRYLTNYEDADFVAA